MHQSLAVPFAATTIVLALAGAYVVTEGRTAPPAAAASATDEAADRGIVVSGVGRTSGTPDVLRAQLGVSVRRADVSTALTDAATAAEKVRAAVVARGVSAKDLQTAQVSVHQSYGDKGVPNGYVVDQGLTVKLRDLAGAGRTITEALRAGGDAARLNGVSFSLEDNGRLLEQARDAAFADAKAKAERYAGLADRPLGAVELVSERSGGAPVPVPYATPARADGGSAPAMTIDAGQSEVSVSVEVRWALR